MGSQVEVSFVMNQLMYCNRPKNPLISFLLLGGAFLIVNFYPSITYQKAQQLPCGYPKGTFMWVQSQPILFDSLKELPQVNDVTLFLLEFHNHIQHTLHPHYASYHVTRPWPFFSKSLPHS